MQISAMQYQLAQFNVNYCNVTYLNVIYRTLCGHPFPPIPSPWQSSSDPSPSPWARTVMFKFMGVLACVVVHPGKDLLIWGSSIGYLPRFMVQGT